MICKILWKTKENGRLVTYRPGDEIAHDHPKSEWLLKCGIATRQFDLTDEPAEVYGRDENGNIIDLNADTALQDDDDEDTTAEDDEADNTADEPAPDNKPTRPRNSAPLEDWRKYATTKGIDHKGMTKAELQAATK